MIGYEDLDDNGDWRQTPDYGVVWVPRTVATGWAPYRYGHWAWVEPWGWTWIDDAAWGFAPFHYGRWVYVGNGWAWVPGHMVARPVYAPALVVFVGGHNWSVAIGAGGGGGVAWFPLAPEEPYVPPYHVSNTYIRNVNVTNVTVTNIQVTNVNVTNINYRNRGAPDAVTVVSHETFVGSRPVNRSVIVVPRDRLEQARVVGSTAQIVPDRQSVLGQPAMVEVRRPPAAVTTREVVVHRQPPPPPLPFASREQALRARPGRPLDDATLTTLRARSPDASARLLVRPAVPATRSQGPAQALQPAREGLPPSRAAMPSVTTLPDDRSRPAQPDAARPAPGHAPAPAAPVPTVSPAPRATFPSPGRSDRPDRAARLTSPPRENKPSPAPTPDPSERAVPARPPAAGRAEPKRQQPERRRPADRPAKDRKAERDTTREQKPS